MALHVGYIPQDMFAPGGANTKQVSRTVEVRFSWSYAPFVTNEWQHAFDDFAIAQVAKILGKTDDVEKVRSSFRFYRTPIDLRPSIRSELGTSSMFGTPTLRCQASRTS